MPNRSIFYLLLFLFTNIFPIYGDPVANTQTTSETPTPPQVPFQSQNQVPSPPSLQNATPITPGMPTQLPQDPYNLDDSYVSPTRKGSMKLAEIILNTPSLHTFLTTLRAAGLGTLLQSSVPYTVFAPNNDAFKRLPPGSLRFLMGLNNRLRLISILDYHIVPGVFVASDLFEGMELYTLNGRPLVFRVNGTDIRVANARIVQTNLIGTNGVLHIIDRVLMP